MKLKYLKQQMLLPLEEHVINQHVNIRGIDVLLLSFTIEKEKNCMWMMYEDNPLQMDVSREEFRTNREEKYNRLKDRSNQNDFFIKEMVIQEQSVHFCSCRREHIYDGNIKANMQLQHFYDRILISEEWDDVDLESIIIAEYEQVEGDTAPSIDDTKEISVSVHIDKSTREVPIQCPFTLQFGKQNIGTKIIYYDAQLGRDNYFFVDEIYSYDFFEDAMKKIDQIKNITMREDMRKHRLEAMENLCPSGKNLAVIRYETIDNVQLQFMMKDYLDSEPEHPKVNSASAIAIIKNSNEVGINGYKLRECILQPVDKNINGEMDIELFSRYQIIPEKIMKSESY